MYFKSQLKWNVVVSPENLDQEDSRLQRHIVLNVMKDFANKKAASELGYLLAVTTLDSVGEGMIRQHTGEVVFPVTFSCISFTMLPWEVLEGTVHKVTNRCVFLKCGPAEAIYLSHQKMASYSYVPGEKPYYQKENSPRIEVGVVLRCVVLSVRFMEAKSDVYALVGMDADYLGVIN